jgi:hypothetical protein
MRHIRKKFGSMMARAAACFAGHDHAGLAVATLRDLILDPGLLHRMALGSGWRESFNRGDTFPNGGAYIKYTRMLTLAIYDYGAGTAYFNAATVLGSSETQEISQHPKQRHAGVGNVDVVISLPVDIQ